MPADQRKQFQAVPTEEFGAEKKSRCERFSHFLLHSDEHGTSYYCGVTMLNWCEIWIALILLWALTTLFWWLMFEAVMVGELKALWGFLAACLIFLVMWAFLLYQGDKELKREEEAERQALFEATRSRQSVNP